MVSGSTTGPQDPHAPKHDELEEGNGNLGTKLFAWQAVGAWLAGERAAAGAISACIYSALGIFLPLPREPEASLKPLSDTRKLFYIFPALGYNK